MKIDTSAIVTATEANQNFSRISKMAEKKGHIVVFKNNRPKLLVIDLDTEPQIEMTEDEKIDFVAARILREHKAAFEELAPVVQVFSHAYLAGFDVGTREHPSIQVCGLYGLAKVVLALDPVHFVVKIYIVNVAVLKPLLG